MAVVWAVTSAWWWWRCISYKPIKGLNQNKCLGVETTMWEWIRKSTYTCRMSGIAECSSMCLDGKRLKSIKRETNIYLIQWKKEERWYSLKNLNRNRVFSFKNLRWSWWIIFETHSLQFAYSVIQKILNFSVRINFWHFLTIIIVFFLQIFTFTDEIAVIMLAHLLDGIFSSEQTTFL